jgi:tetratricopeptide (TPR) repeat protein
MLFPKQSHGKDFETWLRITLSQRNDSVRTIKLFGIFDEINWFHGKKVADQALPFAWQMLTEAKKSGHIFDIAKANQCLAYMHSRAKNYDSSFIYAQKANQVWERIHYYQGIAELRFHFGFLKRGNGTESEILAGCRDALTIAKQHKLTNTWIQVASFMLGYFNETERYDSAKFYGNEILKVPGLTPNSQFYTYYDLGNTYFLTKEFDAARTFYQKASRVYPKTDVKGLLSSVHFSLANVEYASKNYDKAEKMLVDSMHLVDSVERLDFKMETIGLLMDINEKQQDFEQAFSFAKQYNQLSDSLNRQQNQSEFQAELKDKTIREKDSMLSSEKEKRNLILGLLVAVLVISGLSGYLFFLNRKQKENKLNRDIAESEMKALRAQMNPHFMFNSLNAIQQMVSNNENENAYKYLDAYSKMTRQILENSEKKWISVRDEIRFLELYLQIESLRFDHAFQYTIDVSDEVMPNSDKIPAMIVQPIVENAIKHGLINKPGNKNLLIRFDRKDENSPLEVIAEDNGLGRRPTKSKESEMEHHSMSLGITETRLRLLDKQGGNKMEIEDLKNPDGTPAGTRVCIRISQPF